MNEPAAHQPLTTAEQDTLHAGRISRERCICGEFHEDDGGSIVPAAVARLKAYVALNPGHQFVVDDEAGIIAVILTPALNASGPLRILAQAASLTDLLDRIGAPPAETLS